MRPHLLKVAVEPQNSFSVRHDRLPNFRGLWHYHPELELHYVIRGEGVRFIGDNIRNFSAGEVLLLGENLPHCWRCNEEYFKNDPELNVEVIVIQFLPDCLGRYLLTLPEAYLLPKLFEKAKSGMVIDGKAKKVIIDLMKRAVHATDLDRLIIMVSLLKELAENRDYESVTISKEGFYNSNEQDTDRFNKICTYTLSNYKRQITLAEIASVGSLSITSFCRYFKLITKRSYSDFLIQLRISHACRLIVEDKLTIEVICYECGFCNLSNFYRHFKNITALTPLSYKKKYINNAVT